MQDKKQFTPKLFHSIDLQEPVPVSKSPEFKHSGLSSEINVSKSLAKHHSFKDDAVFITLAISIA